MWAVTMRPPRNNAKAATLFRSVCGVCDAAIPAQSLGGDCRYRVLVGRLARWDFLIGAGLHDVASVARHRLLGEAALVVIDAGRRRFLIAQIGFLRFVLHRVSSLAVTRRDNGWGRRLLREAVGHIRWNKSSGTSFLS
jgi:hypothetical protein